MFGFSRVSKQRVLLNQKMGRLINDTFSREHAERQLLDGARSESRGRLQLPCALFLSSEMDQPQQYAVGITSDLAVCGCGVWLTESLELVDYIIALGNPTDRLYVKATCRHCRPKEFGSYLAGFEITEVVNPHDCPAIVRAVEVLESQYIEAEAATAQ